MKYGIKLKYFEKNGWLDAWLDEYNNPDPIHSNYLSIIAHR